MIKKQNKKTNPITDLGISMIPSLAMMGAIGGLMSMSGLFGSDEKTPQKLAEEMMSGAVRGILEHFEYKMDDLKRDNERHIEEIGKLKEEIKQYEEKEKSPKTTQKSKK